MSRKAKYRTICFLLFISGLFSTGAMAAKNLVFTSVDGAFPQHVSEAVLKSAYAKLGVEFETSWLPAKRALLISSSGQADGEISRVDSIAKMYPDLIQVKIPVNYVEGIAISKNKTLPIKSWNSLRPYRIGINNGIIFTVNGTRGMDVEYVNSFSSLFHMLEKERVDVIVSPRLVGLSLMIKNDLKGLVFNEPPVARLNQYHYLHKRHAKLATRLEGVLRKMKKNGEIDRIRSRYLNDLKQGILHQRSQ